MQLSVTDAELGASVYPFGRYSAGQLLSALRLADERSIARPVSSRRAPTPRFTCSAFARLPCVRPLMGIEPMTLPSYYVRLARVHPALLPTWFISARSTAELKGHSHTSSRHITHLPLRCNSGRSDQASCHATCQLIPRVGATPILAFSRASWAGLLRRTTVEKFGGARSRIGPASPPATQAMKRGYGRVGIDDRASAVRARSVVGPSDERAPFGPTQGRLASCSGRAHQISDRGRVVRPRRAGYPADRAVCSH